MTLSSGSGLCKEVQVQVLLPAPYRVFIAKVMNARYFFAHIGLLGAGILLFLLSVKTLISSFYASLFILARSCKRNGIGIFSYICGIPIVQCNGNEKLGQIGAIKITANNFSFSFCKISLQNDNLLLQILNVCAIICGCDFKN